MLKLFHTKMFKLARFQVQLTSQAGLLYVNPRGIEFRGETLLYHQEQSFVRTGPSCMKPY